MPWRCLKLGHDRFLPDPFQFTLHVIIPPFGSTCIWNIEGIVEQIRVLFERWKEKKYGDHAIYSASLLSGPWNGGRYGMSRRLDTSLHLYWQVQKAYEEQSNSRGLKLQLLLRSVQFLSPSEHSVILLGSSFGSLPPCCNLSGHSAVSLMHPPPILTTRPNHLHCANEITSLRGIFPNPNPTVCFLSYLL